MVQNLFDRLDKQYPELAASGEMSERIRSFATGSLAPALFICLLKKQQNLFKRPDAAAFENWVEDVLGENKRPLIHAVAAFSGATTVAVEAMLPHVARELLRQLHAALEAKQHSTESLKIYLDRQQINALRLLPALVAAQLGVHSPGPVSNSEKSAGTWQTSLFLLFAVFLFFLLLAARL
jgi:hypothetical protein